MTLKNQRKATFGDPGKVLVWCWKEYLVNGGHYLIPFIMVSNKKAKSMSKFSCKHKHSGYVQVELREVKQRRIIK